MLHLPWKRRSPATDAAAGPDPVSLDDEPDTVRSTPAGRTIFAARQPIFDRNSTVFGYEILFRDSAENRYSFPDPDVASGVTIEQSAAAFGLDELVGDRLAFVNLSREALLREFYRLLPRERTVIELLETVEPDRAVMAACLRLKAEGYRLALDDFTNAPASLPLLTVADMVKMDFRASGECCDPKVIARLRDRGIHLLAEKVETQQEHTDAIAAGYDLFQGYYYCKPEMIETRDLPPTKLTTLRFLAEVSREDASFERLEELFLHDVGLTVRLLRYLNSAAFGWRHEVSSVRHALELMGLRPLRKWAMMMGLVSLNDDRPPELTVTALTRARFAEQLGPAAGLRQQEFELFLTGMLSLVDAMVGRPTREVVSRLSLPSSVTSALLDGKNAIGSVLHMVTAYERGDWAGVEAARAGSDVDERLLDRAYVSSLQWAEATVRA